VTEPDVLIITGRDSTEPDGGRLRPRSLDERRRGWTKGRDVGRTTVVTGGAIRES